MSDWREALEETYIKGTNNPSLNGWGFDIDEIASRHGPFFSKREVRVMLEEMVVHYPARDYVRAGMVNSILSLHTEGDKKHTLDRDLTKRVAAIEKRVLADGHAKSCEWVEAVLWKESTDVDVECTCGHDEIRENSK